MRLREKLQLKPLKTTFTFLPLHLRSNARCAGNEKMPWFILHLYLSNVGTVRPSIVHCASSNQCAMTFCFPRIVLFIWICYGPSDNIQWTIRMYCIFNTHMWRWFMSQIKYIVTNVLTVKNILKLNEHYLEIRVCAWKKPRDLPVRQLLVLTVSKPVGLLSYMQSTFYSLIGVTASFQC